MVKKGNSMKYNKNLSLGQNAMRGVDITEPDEIFTPENTKWEIDEDENGHLSQHLVYDGDMEELAKETGKSKDELYELLGEYEDESKDLIECQREINESRKGQY